MNSSSFDDCDGSHYDHALGVWVWSDEARSNQGSPVQTSETFEASRITGHDQSVPTGNSLNDSPWEACDCGCGQWFPQLNYAIGRQSGDTQLDEKLDTHTHPSVNSISSRAPSYSHDYEVASHDPGLSSSPEPSTSLHHSPSPIDLYEDTETCPASEFCPQPPPDTATSSTTILTEKKPVGRTKKTRKDYKATHRAGTLAEAESLVGEISDINEDPARPTAIYMPTSLNSSVYRLTIPHNRSILAQAVKWAKENSSSKEAGVIDVECVSRRGTDLSRPNIRFSTVERTADALKGYIEFKPDHKPVTRRKRR